MNQYRYILEKGSKKHICSACGKKKFVRYIDTKTGEYLPEQYGRCDRETNCGYLLNPYTDGYAKMITDQEQRGEYSINWKPQYRPIKKPDTPNPVFIPIDILKHTLQGYEQSVFIQNLFNGVAYPFEAKDIEKVISLYRMGTIQKGYRAGAVSFPFIDIKNNIRAIQVKQFDWDNHTTGTDFLHSIIKKHYTEKNRQLPDWLEAYLKNDLKVSCLFGEHLLNKYPLNPVALVEAPKTAIYGTLYNGFPDSPNNYLWLAVYNVSSLNFQRCKALKGRDVYLFPDLGAYELWNEKAKEIEKKLPGPRFIVSDLLEQNAPEEEKQNGYDLADYLIKQDWHKFRAEQPEPEPIPVKSGQIRQPIKREVNGEIGQPINREIKNKPPQLWNITELETFFSSTQISTTPVKLNQCTTITNIPSFIEGHLATVKRYNGNRNFLPYLHRLQEFKNSLTLT